MRDKEEKKFDENKNEAETTDKITVKTLKIRMKEEKKLDENQTELNKKKTKKVKSVRSQKAKSSSNSKIALGFEPDEILGATDRYKGELTFRIKVKGMNRYELVPAKVANVACPQLVIKFYEERLQFLSE